MNKRIAFVIAFLCTTAIITAQNVLGNRYSLDSDTGKYQSVIQLYQQNHKVYGKIMKLLEKNDEGKLCTTCTGDNKKNIGFSFIGRTAYWHSVK